jgi:ketosteroid isomerase-like protein
MLLVHGGSAWRRRMAVAAPLVGDNAALLAVLHDDVTWWRFMAVAVLLGGDSNVLLVSLHGSNDAAEWRHHYIVVMPLG